MSVSMTRCAGARRARQQIAPRHALPSSPPPQRSRRRIGQHHVTQRASHVMARTGASCASRSGEVTSTRTEQSRSDVGHLLGLQQRIHGTNTPPAAGAESWRPPSRSASPGRCPPVRRAPDPSPTGRPQTGRTIPRRQAPIGHRACRARGSVPIASPRRSAACRTSSCSNEVSRMQSQARRPEGIDAKSMAQAPGVGVERAAAVRANANLGTHPGRAAPNRLPRICGSLLLRRSPWM